MNKAFFVRVRDFVMKSTNGMAIGLFGTLIIGTILDLFGKIPHMEAILVWSGAIKGLMGAGIGLGVGLSLKKGGVTAVALMAAGFVGNYAFHWVQNDEFGLTQWNVSSIGDPLSCYVSVLIAYFAIRFIMRNKTPVDLILIPLVGLSAAIGYSFLLAEWVHFVTIGLGLLVKVSFDAVPFMMCIIISALMGMALTAPISSVAICVAIGIGNVPLAATSALIGCCTQMLGFAVHTARDNKWGSVLAVGIGTSMLQFKNIVRKPIVWLPTIVVSALLGPMAMLFPLEGVKEALARTDTPGAIAAAKSMAASLSVGAGMGTSGLVGPINFIATLGAGDWRVWTLIVCVCVAAPIVLVFLFDLVLRKFNVLKPGDFSLKSDI